MAENRFKSLGNRDIEEEFDSNRHNSNRKDNTISSDNRISERLRIERQKAFATLQKSHLINDVSKTKTMHNKTKDGNQTDYMNLMTTKPFNISDLITDETINLNINTLSQLSGSNTEFKSNQIIFEPNEITGRSTLQSKDDKRQQLIDMMNNRKQSDKRRHQQTAPDITINEILATSFAPKARNLCETFTNTNSNNNALDVTLTETSSLQSDYDGSVSLPRTADMSYAGRSSINDELDVAGSTTLSQIYSFRNCKQSTESTYSSEEFADAELMQSQLLLDEISWAQQYAAIPTKAISAEAKAKAGLSLNSSSQDSLDNVSQVSNSGILKDPNFSVGKFFKIRSDQIRNIFETDKTSPKEKKMSTMETSQLLNNDYNQHELSEIQSKDSASLSDISFLQSLSALDRALGELNLNSKSGRSSVETLQKNVFEEIFSKCDKASSANKGIIKEIFSENKENFDPQILSAITNGNMEAINDTTISFTDSILNASDSRKTERQRQTADRNDSANAMKRKDANLMMKMNSPSSSSCSCSNSNNNALDTANVKDKTLTPINSPSSGHDENDNNNNNHNNSISSNSSKHSKSHRLGVGHTGTSVSASAATAAATNSTTSPNLLLVPTQISPATSTNKANTNNLRPILGSNEKKRKDNRLYFAISPPPTPDIPSKLLNVNGSDHNDTAAATSNQVSPATMRMGNELTVGGYPLRSLSRCSSTTEFCHQHNKQVPLKVTATQLSWFSTRLRKNSRKSMQIKNTGDKRLVLRVEIEGPGFKIYNLQRGNTIALQGLECRTITITFCPTVLGVALGALSFHPPYDNADVVSQQPFLLIPLYGYGGEAYIYFRNVSQGPLGAPFIAFGEITEMLHSVEHRITICNKGSLEGFAVVGIESTSVMGPRLADIFEISPREVLIPPGGKSYVKIILHPKREEFKKLLKKSETIITLATLRIISGDEANRQRFRRLVDQLDDDERAYMTNYIYRSVWSNFEYENEIVELSVFNEDLIIISDMASTFHLQEISLTVRRDPLNDSIDLSSTCLPDADETVLFRTICIAEPPDAGRNEMPICRSISTTTINTINTIASSNNRNLQQNEHETENENENDNENEISSTKQMMSEPDDKSRIWLIKPHQLEFDMKRVEYVVICLQNISKSRQYFEILCQHQQLLEFRPTDSYLLPQQHIQIKIYPHCALRLPIPTETMIFICSKEERVDVVMKLID